MATAPCAFHRRMVELTEPSARTELDSKLPSSIFGISKFYFFFFAPPFRLSSLLRPSRPHPYFKIVISYLKNLLYRHSSFILHTHASFREREFRSVYPGRLSDQGTQSGTEQLAQIIASSGDPLWTPKFALWHLGANRLSDPRSAVCNQFLMICNHLYDDLYGDFFETSLRLLCSSSQHRSPLSTLSHSSTDHKFRNFELEMFANRSH